MGEIAKFFKEARDDIQHTVIYSNYVPTIQSTIDLREVFEKLGILSNKLIEARAQIGEVEINYLAAPYAGERNPPLLKSADYLRCMQFEVKNLLFTLLSHSVRTDLTNLNEKCENNILLKSAVEQHVCALGQMIKDYENNYINENYFDHPNEFYYPYAANINSSCKTSSENKAIYTIKTTRDELAHNDEIDFSALGRFRNMNLLQALAPVLRYSEKVIHRLWRDAHDNKNVTASDLTKFTQDDPWWWTRHFTSLNQPNSNDPWRAYWQAAQEQITTTASQHSEIMTVDSSNSAQSSRPLEASISQLSTTNSAATSSANSRTTIMEPPRDLYTELVERSATVAIQRQASEPEPESRAPSSRGPSRSG